MIGRKINASETATMLRQKQLIKNNSVFQLKTESGFTELSLHTTGFLLSSVWSL
jgi:hypothetical protein